tara:strand:+ start:35 stop:580 length:546 start_codon:yes stop_codon:yes gene_type:complete
MEKMKLIGIGLGGILGVSHFAMIGMLATRSNLPTLNVPVNEYTSYRARVTKDGYDIEYRANDPKTVVITEEVKEKGGFLGLANENKTIVKEVPVDGSLYPKTQGYQRDEIGARSEACIKAIGGGEQTGRMVGGSVGAAVATTGVASIPFVGWVLAGAATMIGMDQGAEIGGNMAEDLNKEC